MDCPVIAVRHRLDGVKELAVEHPAGGVGYKLLALCPLTANKVMQELVSPQRDGGWSRIVVRG
ncbi:MAG: hypothetical protein QME78_00180 [Thermodesulfobacteriota bacterium]|nr:hypothetical protein [Thermodesulfobacteriota bacterium]